jgi:cysteine desulfurase
MIYLDHAATTPVCEAAKKTIIEHLDDFGNPSSAHEFGHKSRLLIEDARERIARCINAEPEEIYFCSGGSEANTWALHNLNALSSAIEHHSAYQKWHFIDVNTDGIINVDKLQNHMVDAGFIGCSDIITCMLVNNELGTIQPIEQIAKIAEGEKYYEVPLHVDAVQAVGHIPVDVKKLGCRSLSMSGHKFGAVKGVGALFMRNQDSRCLEKLIQGGGQESNMRGGTENILGIISMAAALEDAMEHMEEHSAYVKYLRDRMLDKLLQIPGSHLNGSLEHRVASNINIRFEGISGARLVTLCSLYDICISSGSACNEGVATPSHVLKAIGLSDEEALSSIRITIGHENTEQEIDEAADIITRLVRMIRDE